MARVLKDCKVLVTPTSYGVNDPALRTQLEAEIGEVDWEIKIKNYPKVVIFTIL